MYFFEKNINIKSKMRYFLSTLLIFFGLQAGAVTFDGYYPDNERETQTLIMRKGTIIRVMNMRDINTFSNDIGDDCEFINVVDMFLDEYLALPRNSHIYGTIEDIREPVQGNNAAIKIKVHKIVTADGDNTFFIEGHIFGPNNNYLGGEETKPAYYKTTPHYIEGWGGGILQLSPLNIYEFGKHKQIKAGEEIFVILDKDLKIY